MSGGEKGLNLIVRTGRREIHQRGAESWESVNLRGETANIDNRLMRSAGKKAARKGTLRSCTFLEQVYSGCSEPRVSTPC